MPRAFLRSFTAAVAFLCAAASAQTIERVRLTDNDLSCAQIHAEVQQMDTAIQLAGATGSATPMQAATPSMPASVQAAAPGQPLSAVQQAVLSHPNNANLSPEQKAALLAQTGMAEARGNAAVGSLYGGAVPQGNFAFQGAVMADPNVRASIARARAAGMSDAQIAATLGVGMQRAGLPQVPAGVPVALPGAAGLGGMFGAIAGAAQQAQVPQQQLAPQQVPAQGAPAYAAANRPAQAPGLAQQAQARKEHLTMMFLSRNCKLADVQK